MNRTWCDIVISVVVSRKTHAFVRSAELADALAPVEEDAEEDASAIKA